VTSSVQSRLAAGECQKFSWCPLMSRWFLLDISLECYNLLILWTTGGHGASYIERRPLEQPKIERRHSHLIPRTSGPSSPQCTIIVPLSATPLLSILSYQFVTSVPALRSLVQNREATNECNSSKPSPSPLASADSRSLSRLQSRRTAFLNGIFHLSVSVPRCLTMSSRSSLTPCPCRLFLCLYLSLTRCTASLAAQSPCALAFRTFAPHGQYVAVARARTRPSRVQDMKISASKTNGVTSSTLSLQMRACDLAGGRFVGCRHFQIRSRDETRAPLSHGI
jgi:hypothetical protein